MDAEFKGSSEHAAQYQHGVVPRTAPPAPRTIEQRVAAIEALISEDSGKTVEQLLAESRSRRKRIDEIPAGVEQAGKEADQSEATT